MKDRILAVTGLQWGDEGKGRVCNDLARGADIIVRVQGGANAGHTIYSKGRKFVFHLLPCGVLYPEKTSLLGPAVFVDPIRLAKEIADLKDAGLNAKPGHVIIDFRAPMVLPWHWAMDSVKGGKIGTTGRGIGPVAKDFYAREALNMAGILKEPEVLERSYANYMKKHECQGFPAVEHDQVDAILQAVEKLRPLVGDSVTFLQEARQKNRKILLEGAQGALLDVLFGTYPFVTSSLTGVAALPFLAGLGYPKNFLGMGVTKAYTTRVGNGPFPSEDLTASGEKLRSLGEEFGATTGRPRRCGWLDLPALEYACKFTGTNALIITKLDVLAMAGEFKVAVAYKDHAGNRVPWTRVTGDLDRLSPVYERMKAGESRADAPWVKNFATFIETRIGVPVIGVTMGKSTNDATYFIDPWNKLPVEQTH